MCRLKSTRRFCAKITRKSECFRAVFPLKPSVPAFLVHPTETTQGHSARGGVRIGEFVSFCFKGSEFGFTVRSHSSAESDLPWGMLVMPLLAGQIHRVTLKAKEGRQRGPNSKCVFKNILEESSSIHTTYEYPCAC